MRSPVCGFVSERLQRNHRKVRCRTQIETICQSKKSSDKKDISTSVKCNVLPLRFALWSLMPSMKVCRYICWLSSWNFLGFLSEVLKVLGVWTVRNLSITWFAEIFMDIKRRLRLKLKALYVIFFLNPGFVVNKV